MKILAYETFRRLYKELPSHIQKKVDKQITILAENPRHPSIQLKKIRGTKNIWEARVDLQYRMSLEISAGTIFLRVVGNHDNVLKKP